MLAPHLFRHTDRDERHAGLRRKKHGAVVRQAVHERVRLGGAPA